MSLAKERAQAGAAFLDEVLANSFEFPWYEMIDLASLDMGDGLCCILGQLFYSYGYGVEKLNLTDNQVIDLGFCTPSFSGQETYHDLTGEWHRIIKEKLDSHVMM